jgi:hypothetical protein
MLQREAGSSSEPLGEPVATSEHAVEFPAEGMEEHLKPPLLGVSSTDIPLQGAGSSSKPAAGGLEHLLAGIGGPCLAKKALSGCSKRKLKKARAGAIQAGTGGSQQPGPAGSSKQGETPTGTLKRPQSEGSIPTKTIRTP